MIKKKEQKVPFSFVNLLTIIEKWSTIINKRIKYNTINK